MQSHTLRELESCLDALHESDPRFIGMRFWLRKRKPTSQAKVAPLTKPEPEKPVVPGESALRHRMLSGGEPEFDFAFREAIYHGKVMYQSSQKMGNLRWNKRQSLFL